MHAYLLGFSALLTCFFSQYVMNSVCSVAFTCSLPGFIITTGCFHDCGFFFFIILVGSRKQHVSPSPDPSSECHPGDIDESQEMTERESAAKRWL